jgi:hypothetical protein
MWKLRSKAGGARGLKPDLHVLVEVHPWIMSKNYPKAEARKKKEPPAQRRCLYREAMLRVEGNTWNSSKNNS